MRGRDLVWHVAVLGQTSPEQLHRRITEILSSGEPVTLPDDDLIALNEWRGRQTELSGLKVTTGNADGRENERAESNELHSCMEFLQEAARLRGLFGREGVLHDIQQAAGRLFDEAGAVFLAQEQLNRERQYQGEDDADSCGREIAPASVVNERRSISRHGC